MAAAKSIKFDLINNAKDSLRRAVAVLAWRDIESTDARFKQAILNVAHCAELLLKERLRQVNPAFVWEDIDKYPGLSARTVTVDKAISRLENIAKVSLAEKDKKALSACRQTRNAIEHHEFEITEKEAKVILGNVLSFIFFFAKTELKSDFEEEFKSDDTWRSLLDEFYEFARAHGERIAAVLAARDVPLTTCSECEQYTVDIRGGACELCGHWYDPDDEG
jgi:hypothetical protein